MIIQLGYFRVFVVFLGFTYDFKIKDSSRFSETLGRNSHSGKPGANPIEHLIDRMECSLLQFIPIGSLSLEVNKWI